MFHNLQLLILLQVVILLWLRCSQAKIGNEVASQVPLIRIKRVVGGYPTHIDEVPYLVNIRKKYKFHCGGSLLTSKCVLTAAHCVRNATEKDFIVRGGVTYLNEFQDKSSVRQILIHPYFDTQNLNRDLAILVLKEPMLQPRSDTINLSEMPGPRTKSYVTVSGWGLTSERAKNPPNQIHSVQLKVIPAKLCQSYYKNFRNVTENMFCTAATEQRDACIADSGGPAINEFGELVGVVSWGRRRECARPLSPGVFVNIQSLKPWIEQTLQEQCF